MSRSASPRAIGLFVLGALALAVLGILIFGGSLLLGGGDRYVIHFDESLKGLRIGAPVVFRGVEVGEVREIRAIFEPRTGAVQVPVVVELRRGALAVGTNGAGGAGVIETLVRDGLKARLDLQTIVTGQLLVALDFYPGRATAAAATPLPGSTGGGLPEIPAIRSTWAGLQQTVDQALLNAPEIARTLADLVTALHGLLTGPAGEQLRQGVASFSNLLQRMSDPDGPLARTVAELPPLVQGLGATARAMPELVTRLAALAQASEGLVAATRDLVGKSDTRLLAVVDDVGRLTVSLRKVADQGSALLAENRDGIKDFTDSGLPQLTGLVEDATRMVNELNGAIRDMRQDPARFFLGNRDRQGVRLQ